LLLQRAGRLHRHERADGARPEGLRAPRMVVTGMVWNADAPPEVPRGSEYIYGEHLLYRTAAMVSEAEQSGWSVPADVPALVTRVYGDELLGPSSWHDAMAAAEAKWAAKQRDRRASARDFLLAGDNDLGRPTLAGLHEQATADLADDDRVAAVVRDGDESVEVVLVRRGGHGFLTLSGRPMGVNGEAVSDPAVLEEVARATIRLPASRPTLTNAALALRPLPGWGVAGAWLGHARALVLENDLSASLGGLRLTYDNEIGLTVDREEGGA
jgi:CRISPR-associated endonuclease/helicase Cas3